MNKNTIWIRQVLHSNCSKRNTKIIRVGDINIEERAQISGFWIAQGWDLATMYYLPSVYFLSPFAQYSVPACLIPTGAGSQISVRSIPSALAGKFEELCLPMVLTSKQS